MIRKLRSGQYRLYSRKIDARTGKHRNLFLHTKLTLPASGGSAADYDVSPDGKEICFVSDSAKELGMDNNLDLFIMPTVLARVKEYRARFGDYWRPAQLLERLVAEGRGFYTEPARAAVQG